MLLNSGRTNKSGKLCILGREIPYFAEVPEENCQSGSERNDRKPQVVNIYLAEFGFTGQEFYHFACVYQSSAWDKSSGGHPS